jgi:hypothetical protein
MVSNEIIKEGYIKRMLANIFFLKKSTIILFKKSKLKGI